MKKKAKEVAYVIIAALMFIMSICIPNYIANAKETIKAPTAGVLSAVNMEVPTSNTVMVSNPIPEVQATPLCTDYDVPSNNGNKTYMDAKCIRVKSSDQYKLKSQYIYEPNGLITIGGRYCIAVGSYYTTKVGTEIDLVMENGDTIECILADCKADSDTDSLHRQNPNGSIVEFVVDTDTLPHQAKIMGDISYISEVFAGEIKSIRILEED